MGNVIINDSQTLTALTCWVCGIHFAMPQVIERQREMDGNVFFCPNGDKISYGPSLLEQERDKLKRRDAQLVHERDQRQAAERSASAYKGQVTRIKKRVGNGVCPCCQRHFTNVERHMSTQHPDFREGVPDVFR